MKQQFFAAWLVGAVLVGAGWVVASADSQPGDAAGKPACAGCPGCPGGSCPAGGEAKAGEACPLAATSVSTAAAKEEGEAKPEAKILCPLSGGEVDKAVSADYKGGHVYFCCGDCKAKFEQDPAKYALKANQQLVASGQAKQIACPLTGRPVNPEKKVTIAGQEVGLCCGGCVGKITGLEEEKQVEMVFGDSGFDKGFKVPAETKPET